MKIKRENIYKYIGIGAGVLTVGIFSFFMLNKPNSNGNTCKIDNCQTYRCEENDCCECGVCSEGYSITNDYTCTKNNNSTAKQDNPISVVENQSWETNYSTSMQTKGFKGATNGKGNITYSISTETNSNGVKVDYFSIPVKDKASIKMNSKTPVGTYVVVIMATATGNNEYESKSKDITMTIKVKKQSSTTPTPTPTPTPSTVKVTGVSINKSDVSVLVNKKVTLKATVSPDNATNKNVTWKSSNTSIAKVSSSGVVTGVKAGTATITVTTKDGSKTATCKVTVTKKTIAVKSVSLDKTTLKIEAGKTGTIKATVDPSNATDAEVTWESSDKKIATVNSSGVVTGVKAGTATITAKTSNGKKATCEVTVTKAATVKVTKVSLDKTKLSLAFGKGSTLTATVKPDNATNKEVTWASSNEKIVTVDKSGLVKGIKVGTAKVTVTTKDGSKKATCEVTVNKASNPITVTATQSWNANYLTSAQTKNFKEATKAQGKVTYAIHSQKNSSGTKVSYFSIPTNTEAKIKMKAKTPKGTYTVSIYATAAGNDNYKSGTREIIMTVKVKAKAAAYVITEDSKYDSYKSNVIASCDSSTLKYKIIQYRDSKNLQQNIVLVWVKDAYKQMNTALANDKADGEGKGLYEILKDEKKNYFSNYSSGCMVAINASFFNYHKKSGGGTTSTQESKIIISKGKVYRDQTPANILGFNNQYKFKRYWNATLADYQKEGVRTTVMSYYGHSITTVDGKIKVGDVVDPKSDGIKTTQFCQVDKNNYVLLVGVGGDHASAEMYRVTGCSYVDGLDGSDSSQLFYQNGSDIKSVRSSSRHIVDGLYFSEHLPSGNGVK